MLCQALVDGKRIGRGGWKGKGHQVIAAWHVKDPGGNLASGGTSTPKVEPAKEVDQKEKVEPRHAPRYRVLIHNDDVTPMIFVISVLCRIFRKEGEAATEIMLTAHHHGVALVDVLPLEEAEFRVERAHAMARTAKYPLTFSYEPE